MGKHYVPQRYLRNFEDPEHPGLIWLFDRRTRKTSSASISKVAQESDFYDDDVEMLLNQLEMPANPVIQKLCNGEHITSSERVALALYIAVMLKRVPHRRERGLAIFPDVSAHTFSAVRSVLDEAEHDPSADLEIIRNYRAELDALQERYRREPPLFVQEQLRTPWPTDQIVDCINRMSWRVLETSGPNLFLTSDNPVFLFESYGLANKESELNFALCSQRALHGCWQGNEAGLHFVPGQQQFVKELNRRVASTTTRFAFYHENASWVHTLLGRSSPDLSRINW